MFRAEEETGVKIYPIIGVGSAPFRGNLKPKTIDRVCEEYPSVMTYTIQSSFKYDHPFNMVSQAITKLKSRKRKNPQEIEEETHTIADHYANPKPRMFPVAVTFLVPERYA